MEKEYVITVFLYNFYNYRSNEDKKTLKRKPPIIVSEFDSGLSALKHTQAPKRRKVKWWMYSMINVHIKF